MSKLTSDGGPAFPTLFIEPNYGSGYAGMNLRDYFAAAIMQGLMSSQCQVDDPYPIYAYRQADAMIKAREVK